MRKLPKRKLARKLFAKHTDKFHLALGQFVAAFSLVEVTLLKALCVLAHVRAPYAQALLSGVRTDAAMSYINRIAEAERWPDDKRVDWQRIFSQLGLINKLRNDILHHGAGIAGNSWLVSNRRVAHHPDRIREMLITPAIINDATADAGDITTLLMLLGGPSVGIVMNRNWRSWMRKRLREPWRYKQPPQVDWLRMMTEIPPKQPPPPESSRG